MTLYNEGSLDCSISVVPHPALVRLFEVDIFVHTLLILLFLLLFQDRYLLFLQIKLKLYLFFYII